MIQLHLSTFRADITPPVGHPLCGGWIQPACGISDPLSALGMVLLGDDDPIVLCALDWCEISNGEHLLWREKLAAAADTTPDRVAVQCVHTHNAPWPDRDAQRLVRQASNLADFMDESWCESILDRIANAARASAKHAQPLTHVGIGEAKVDRVASNRRILGPDGKVRAMRFSRCKEAEVRAEPEGLIDPFLKTISFWNGDTKLAALHTYAVHPMSFYGDGLVTSDFVGHARERRTAEEGIPHLYLTGCAGDIGAGKYNDGDPKYRPLLAERVHRAMVESERAVERLPLDRVEWRVQDVQFPPDLRQSEEEWRSVFHDTTLPPGTRYQAALRLTYLQRFANNAAAIPLTSLRLGAKIWLLLLPGEPFIEHQLFAQQQRPQDFVAVAGYSDCCTGYIPPLRCYDEGGYEPTDAFVSPEADGLLRNAIVSLLRE